jgi:hypothetical protein
MPRAPQHILNQLIFLNVVIHSVAQSSCAVMTRPHFMRPCKSWSLDYRSLFDTSRLVKNKNGLCVPVLIGPIKLGPNKHGQFVLMINT